ncbi:hypothetical protein ALTERO38_50719 [Alteromonas sp. 38]|nr:hypothetical protein ALTER154_80547 [Alteromonas sp. 154]VXB45054.1 hypothetical protein ALTERO38_50719 [Alteromonas sp. 38]
MAYLILVRLKVFSILGGIVEQTETNNEKNVFALAGNCRISGKCLQPQ